MEKIEEGDAGYPEVQPEEVAPHHETGGKTSSTVRESARPEREAAAAPSNDDGTATGNPNAAGADKPESTGQRDS